MLCVCQKIKNVFDGSMGLKKQNSNMRKFQRKSTLARSIPMKTFTSALILPKLIYKSGEFK